MSAIISNETITRARSATIAVTVGSLGASGLNAYSDIRFTAKRDTSDSDASAIITKSLTSGVTITTVGDTTTDGMLSVALTPADTTALPSGYTSTLQYDVTLYDAVGDAYTVAGGVLTVTPNVTQATS